MIPLVRHLFVENAVQMSVLPEFVSFLQGTKKTIRLTSERQDNFIDISLFRRFGFQASDFKLYSKDFGNGFANLISEKNISDADGYFPVKILCLSHSKLDLNDFVKAEVDGDTEKAGALLGYPTCCVSTLNKSASLGKMWALYYLEDFKINGVASCHTNRFPIIWGGISAIGELFPCSLSCPNAINYSKRMLSDLESFGYRKVAKVCIEKALQPVHIVESSGLITNFSNFSSQVIKFT